LKKAKVYLDLCALKRPYDAKTSDLVTLEALSVAALVEAIEYEKIEIICSDVLVEENARNPNSIRREGVSNILALADDTISFNKKIGQRAGILEEKGFKTLDALHLASAEYGVCDYFVTTDYRLLKAAKLNIGFLEILVISPVDLLERMEQGEIK